VETPLLNLWRLPPNPPLAPWPAGFVNTHDGVFTKLPTCGYMKPFVGGGGGSLLRLPPPRTNKSPAFRPAICRWSGAALRFRTRQTDRPNFDFSGRARLARWAISIHPV